MPSPEGILRTLPYEIAYQVIQYLDRVYLKNCRLVNQQLEPPARRALFLEVHVITTVQSLQNATRIGRSPRLSSHVKTFVYHASTLLSGGFRDLETISISFDDRNLDTFTTALNARAIQLYEGFDPVTLWQDYNTILQARQDLEKHGYVSQRLKNLISYFPYIDTVMLQPMLADAPYYPHEHMPGLCRIDENAFTDLLATIYHRPLSHLSASALHWGSFRPCNDLNFMLSSLKILDLSIRDTQIGYPYDHMRQEFNAFLTSCKGLETFSLDIGILLRPNRRPNRLLDQQQLEAIQIASDLVLQNVWPRLRSVSFTNLITSKERLGGFFANNKKNLRRVSMKDIKIGELRGEFEMIYLGRRWRANTPLVAVCTTIRENCSLEHANLGGSFWTIPGHDVDIWGHQDEFKELEEYMCC